MVGIQSVGAALSFLSVLFLAAALGPEIYGLYAWIVSIGSVGSLLVQRGLPTTILKLFAPISLGELKYPSPLVNTQILYIFATLVAILIASVVAFVLRSTNTSDVVWALPIAFAMASFTTADAILRSAGLGARAQIAGQIIRPSLLLMGAFGIWCVGSTHLGPYLALYSTTFLMATVAFLWGVVWMGLSEWRDGGLIRSNAAHFQVSISHSVGKHLPIFITGFFVNPESLAYLAIAIRVTGPTRFGLNAARAHFGARINGAIKMGAFDRARSDYVHAARFSVSVAAIIAALCIGLVYTLAVLQRGPFASFDAVLLTMVVAISAMSHLAFTMFGPAQLVAILLGNEKFIRNLNFVALVLFAAGLCLAAVTHNVLYSATVMLLYSLGLVFGVAWNVRSSFNTLEGERVHPC